jgi:hypothetical protein
MNFSCRWAASLGAMAWASLSFVSRFGGVSNPPVPWPASSLNCSGNRNFSSLVHCPNGPCDLRNQDIRTPESRDPVIGHRVM